MKSPLRFIVSIFASFMIAGSVQAQSLDDQRELVNRGVVTVLGGSIGGTYSQILWDMSTLFDDGYDLRVLPVLGKGSFKGIEDLMLLKGIDAALVQSDVLEFYRSIDLYPNLDKVVRYINVFYNEEVHIVARNDIKSVEELEGKTVNFGPTSSGTFMTSGIIFDLLGVSVTVTDASYQDAVSMLKRGEIDAFVRVAGAPVKLLQGIQWEDGMHILPIPKIDGPYYEATVNHDDYPGLIAQGEEVQTAAVAAVLAAYNWPADHERRKPVEKLYNALADRIDEFKVDPFHPKWQQVEFDRDLPGWTRWENLGDPGS